MINTSLNCSSPWQILKRNCGVLNKFCCYILQVLGYVKLAVNEGGEIVCGEGKDPPLNLPSPHTEV